jgi:hydroxymethylpyrimidine/phosphomethylpyrimidine kinase
MTTVLTPNVPEAKLLLSDAGHEMKDPQCIDDLIDIAKAVQSLGPEYVLVKGGHLPFKADGTVAVEEAERETVVDILYGNGEVLRIDSAYRKSRNTHGTGCSLACE